MKILNGAWKISMLVVLSASIYLTACTKKAQLIGLEIRSTGNLEVKSTDTSSVVAYSILQDSIITTNYRRILLGSMMDPVFGQTTANYYTQLRLELDEDELNFGENAVVDSLILSLAYDGYYGDINTLQTLRVYELSEKLISDSGYYYYSSDKALHSAIEIGRITFQPKPDTPVSLTEGDTIAPQIRINLTELTSEFANKLISAPLDVLQSNESFTDYIYGFCVKSDPVSEKGAMMYIDVVSVDSDLTLFYSNDSASGISYAMKLYDSTTRFNEYDHNNYLEASSEFKSQVIDGETILGEEKIYIQSLGGVATKINFPFIQNLKANGKIAINSAELTFKPLEENNGNNPPEILILVQMSTDGTLSSPLIDFLEGEASFGGFYDTINKEYKFQINRFLQQLLADDTSDDEIYLKINGSYNSAGQFILNGTNPALPTPYSDRLKLKVTYTIVE